MNSCVVIAAGSAVEARQLRLAIEAVGIHVEEAGSPSQLPEAGRTLAFVLGGAEALAAVRRLGFRSLDDRPLLFYLAPDDSPASRLAGFAAGADAVVPVRATDDEVAAHLRVFERWHDNRRRWRDRAAEAQLTAQQLQIAYRQIDLDLAIARRLQASFLPQTLPAVGATRFGVSYRPCGQVGGDFYDVVRLDEHHVGFYLADAMGHGVPASLLTVFLKKAVQPKEVFADSYRLVPPDQVLARLNRELMSQGLADMPFITMIYGLLDCRSGDLQLARAAHPHPVYVPVVGQPEQWQTPGTLLGIFEAEYPPIRRTLRPGDKLLVYTDGLSATGTDPAAIFAAATEHRGLPIRAMVDRVSERVLAPDAQPDDFTLLGVEMLA